MKKVNLKLNFTSIAQYKNIINKVFNIFLSKNGIHLEINFVIDKLQSSEINDLINDLNKQPSLKDIYNENICTFIFTISANSKIISVISKVKSNISRIDIVYSTQCNLKDTILELKRKHLPCSILIRENDLSKILKIYHEISYMKIFINVERRTTYSKTFFDELKIWITDLSGCRINIFSNIISKILQDYWGTNCEHVSCITKFFNIDCNGGIYSCKYNSNPICNINDINSIDDIFNNINFLTTLKASIDKREKCKNECEYFKLCQGGCPLNTNTSKTCEYKYLFSSTEEIRGQIIHILNNSDYREINPAVKEIILASIASNKAFEKEMIN